MARKPLFQSLVEGSEGQNPPQKETSAFPASRPMQKMKTSLMDLQKSAIQDIDLELIDNFHFHDRIYVDEDLEELMESLREHGQEVPIKVRPVPGSQRFEVIIGRRRCAAARSLGWKTIKGLVQEKDDLGALASMISENKGRRETSYIGRARLASMVVDSGVFQKDLAKAIGMSQGHISQLLRSYSLAGDALVQAIGDAVGHGRGTWDPIGEALIELEMSSEDAAALVDDSLPSSSERLEDLSQKISRMLDDRRAQPPSPTPTKAKAINQDIGHGSCVVRRNGNAMTIRKGKKGSPDLLDFIQERLPSLVEEFNNQKNDE